MILTRVRARGHDPAPRHTAPVLLRFQRARMKSHVAPIPFAGRQLDSVRHVCAFFNSDDEEYRVMLPFIRDGFACGDKAVHVVSRPKRDDHLHRLAAAGIDAELAQQRGQLEIHTNTDTYLREGRFDPDRMLQVFEQMASGTAGSVYPLS